MIKESHIAISVKEIFKTADFVIPNVSWAFIEWEADLLIITKAGRINEVEIKVSVADFRADAKKDKWLKASINQRFNEIINCFYYAMPLEIYDKVKNEIPAFAGVITYNQRNKTASIIKKAKINRSAKYVSSDDKLKLARLLNFRYWNIVNKKQRIKNNACN